MIAYYSFIISNKKPPVKGESASLKIGTYRIEILLGLLLSNYAIKPLVDVAGCGSTPFCGGTKIIVRASLASNRSVIREENLCAISESYLCLVGTEDA